MRCYHFGNFYMSTIQQGIQAAHAQMELFLKYQPLDSEFFDKHFETNNDRAVYEGAVQMLFEWASSHKTMICLNGGTNLDLQRIEGIMEMDDNPYPWSSFYEEEGALTESKALTNVAIIIPEKIYETASNWKKYTSHSQYFYAEFDARGGCIVTCPHYDKDNDQYTVEHVVELSPFEVQLVDTLSNCRLAG